MPLPIPFTATSSAKHRFWPCSGGESHSVPWLWGHGDVRPVSGVGRVLVAQGDKAVYTSNVEANGKIACNGACNAFWKPVAAAGAHPSGGNGTGKLGVITRPDGTMQLTANGKPLYTFSEDSAGKASGDGFKDDFSGHHFTWHLVRAGGTPSSGGQQSGGGSAGGGGTPYGGSGGGY